MPVIYAASGNCHVYVHASADLDTAEAIVAQRQDPAARRVQRGRDAARSRRRRRRRSCPRAGARCASAGVELRVDGARARLAGGAGGALVDATDADWAEEFLALVLAVGVVDSVDEAIEHVNELRLRALGGDRHARRGGGAGVPARRRCGVRLRQRLHALHRRRRVRHGRRDRQLDAEAARARADRPARAVHVQVPGRGRRPRPRVRRLGARRTPRRDVQPAAPRAPGRARRRRATSSGSSGSLLLPVTRPPHKEVAATRARGAAGAVPARGGRGRRLEVSRVEIDRGGPVVHGRYPEGAA